jgi:Fe-S-cluster containining protein
MTDTRERTRTAGRSRADSGTREGPVASGALLPVIQKDSDHPCFQCAKCCTYVAIEIDPPTTMKEYDYIVWYLYHEGLSVFVDWEGDWFVKFETHCKHLTPQGLCGVYDSRPAICKDFDWRDCENTNRDEPPDKWLFEEAEDFLAWLQERRPKSWARFRRFLRRKHETGEEPELERVKVTQILPPPGAARGKRRKR